ncbi:hypothetical protein P7H54_12640, partial [Lactococcus lactis]
CTSYCTSSLTSTNITKIHVKYCHTLASPFPCFFVFLLLPKATSDTIFLSNYTTHFWGGV